MKIPSSPPLMQSARYAMLLLACTVAPLATATGMQGPERACTVIEDFEAYAPGQAPYEWKTNKGRRLIAADEQTMVRGRNTVEVRAEQENNYARMMMTGYAYRLIKLNEEHFDWDADACPVLSWQWRIAAYPADASERDDDRNDVAAAVYVTFGRDWLGRPISIKYTFSSTLPVGTVTDYGALKVLVVQSAKGGAAQGWTTIERDVMADYEELFGKQPKTPRPAAITLFSDADDVAGATATADFDNVSVRGQL